MKKDNSGLLIAALVAIVAVVGLVILFKGGSSGAAVCPAGQDLVQVANPDGQSFRECRATGAVRYVPDQAPTPGTPQDSFQTHQQNLERRYAIAQRDWEFN